MKITVIIVRVLMGLLFIFASVVVLFNLVPPPPEQPERVRIFMEGVNATGYLLPLIKITELVCGIAFVSGRFVALASVVIAPVIVNIFLFHLLVDRSGLPVAVFLVLANLFVAYANREKYVPLFAAK
ncbi:MAG: DoxX family protein [Acidobacteria bacterium]|nr:DoxX family protein [Acidobacteriota bacterium]